MAEVYINIPDNNGGGGAGVSSLNGQTGALTLIAGTNVTIVPGSGTLTINASGGGGSVTAVTGSSPIASSGGTTPNITIQNADATHTGALTLTDWNTFNNKQNALTIGNLTTPGVSGISITGGTGAVIGTGTSVAQQKSDASHNGYLSAADWTTFNNKLNASQSNYITNPDAETNTAGWNLYNDSGRTVPAYLVNQDITYTSTLSGDAGNGVEIEYVYNASFPSSTPNINVISSSHVQVQWNNGPTVANNPTATQLAAAWNAVGAATAIATIVITGTPSKLQYITGASFLANGGDTSPVDGTGGVPAGVTFTRNTSTPLVGVASFDLGKDAANREGQGVSTDFTINSLDKGNTLQISFAYEGSAGMVLGTSSDAKVFIYDVTNAVLIPVTAKGAYIPGPTGTPKVFTGQFLSNSTSVNYRLIVHISTQSTTAWDLLLDSVVVNSVLVATPQTQVPSLVISGQPISGAVTDHMVVMWKDGATQWVPATIAGAALPTFGTDITQLGFATNIVGATADIFIRGYMNGFSFGPFAGFEQYIDNIAGGISPLPSPFTDLYVMVGMAISATELNIQFDIHIDKIANSSGVPLKGGLLSSSAANDGTGDLVLSVGGNGNVLVANSAASLGINWAPAVVATSPLVYTTSTRALTLSTVPIASGGTGSTTFTTNATLTSLTALTTASSLASIGTVTTGTWNATSIAIAHGGTGQTTANAAFNALSPLTTLGDIIYENATPAATRLAGNTTTTKNFLTQTGNGTISAAPVWGTIGSADVSNSSAVTGTTVTDALNTLNQNVQEVLLSAINNGSSTTANTTLATWTTVSKDTLSGFVASTGIYTIASAGDYNVDFSAATTSGTPLAQVYHNGSLVQTGIGSGVRTTVNVVVPNCVVGDTITVALDSSLTLTSTNTDTILNISRLSGASSSVVNARYFSATATITGSLSTVTYSTKSFDTQSAAYSSGVYTIPSAGKYLVKASLAVTATTVAAGNIQTLIIRKNSVEIARYEFVSGAATQKPAILIVEDLISCATNDTIDVQVSSASTTPVVTVSTTMNFFYLNKVSN